MKKILLILMIGFYTMQSSAQGTLQLMTGSNITGNGNGSFIVIDNMNVVNNGSILLSGVDNTVKITGNLGAAHSGTGTTELSKLVNSTSATFTLSAPVSLYNQLTLASGTLASAGFLTMKSLPANTAVLMPVTSGSITGDVIVERYISSSTNRAYRLLGPSVNTSTSIHANWQEGATSNTNNPKPNYGTHITGTTVDQTNGFDATITGQGSLFTYNQVTPAWVAAANTDFTGLDGKTGYLLYVRGDRSIDLTSQASPLPSTNTTLRATGTLLTGVQTYSSLVGNGGFGLITNPYASSINWNTIYAHNNTSNFENYYTYWDPNIGARGGYITVTNGGVTSPAASGTVNIQSGQAFFVKSKTGVISPALSIIETDKSTTNNIDVFRVTSAAQKFTASLYYNDAEHGRRLADGVTALYDNSYNAALDGNDAIEINNFDENIAIARQGQHLSIEERPIITASDTLTLFMNNMKQQGYEFEFNPTNLNPNTTARLVDKFTASSTVLNVTATTIVPFTITSDALSSATDRFYILFSLKPVLPVAVSFAKGLQIYPNPVNSNTLNLQMNMDRGSYTISVINKLGQVILTKVIDHAGGSVLQTLQLPKTLTTGVYQVKLTGTGNTIIKQVIKN